MERLLLESMADILETEVEKLNLETEFKTEEYDWDSLKGYAILVMLEEEFQVEMPVDDFIEAKKIQDLFNYIHTHTDR
ncbi:acyl carrier protein [Aminipila terrae]|uniref:Acyl carrier protein n=1 Tax=Aminipila terrae TaxID=2697030 RepID=A0A6P1MBR7_9FIRM|nr:acyl carrier protein [Aminipila terrae]QHI72080.1 acyl carrier protein [Aminipila terrae]